MSDQDDERTAALAATMSVNMPHQQHVSALAAARKHIHDLPDHVIALAREFFGDLDRLAAERVPVEEKMLAEIGRRPLIGERAEGDIQALARANVAHHGLLEIADLIGRACAQAEDGVELLERTTAALRTSCRPLLESIDLGVRGRVFGLETIKRNAQATALVEAARAWTWLPHGEADTAADRYQYIAHAERWLSDAREGRDVRASFAVQEFVAALDTHDLVRDAVIARILADPPIPDNARDKMAALLRERMNDVYAEAGSVESNTSPPYVDGLMYFDAAFAKVIAATGSWGEKRAKRIRQEAPQLAVERGTPWYGYLPSVRPVKPPTRLDLLARAIWYDVLGPKISAPSTSAGPVAVIRDLALVATTSESPGSLSRDKHRGTLNVAREGGGNLEPTNILLLTSSNTSTRLAGEKAATSDYFWSVITWLMRTVQVRELLGETDPHILVVDGGDDGLRRAARVTHKGAASEVRQILDFLHTLGSASAPGKGRLLSVNRVFIPQPGGIGRPTARTVIEVGLLLRPKKARELGLPSAFDVPVLHPSLLPTVGDRRTKARQINTLQALMLHAHDHRLDIARDGAFPLSKSQWTNHAQRWGLYHRSHASLSNRLFDKLHEPVSPLNLPFDRRGNEAMLVRVGPDRYRLGDVFLPEWEHFVDQGKRSQAQSERAKKRARQRSP